MKSFRFTVKGRPVPWKRLRTKGKSRFPAPGQTEAKDAVRAAYKAAEGTAFAPKGQPVVLTVHAVFALPESMRKSDPRKMGDRHTMTPDGDNLVKLVKDALNGLAYVDDCQVSDCHVRKQWSDYNATHITIELPNYENIARTKASKASATTPAPTDHNANKERRL